MKPVTNSYARADFAIAILIAAILFVGFVLYTVQPVSASMQLWFLLLPIVIIIGSLPLLFEIISSLSRGHFGVDIIALVAIIFSLSTGETIAGAIVLLMLSGGDSLEHFAQRRARSSIERLLQRAPTIAHLHRRQEIVDVPVSEIRAGDILIVKPGEIIPLDGTIIEGMSIIDESVITGEPLPRDVLAGSQIVSGTTNGAGLIKFQASDSYEKSVFAGILRLTSQAEAQKAPIIHLADTYSVFFTAITFAIACFAWIISPKLATAVLVVATPCPLILAAPIAFIAGMGRAARKGIIVKHGGVFETLVKAKAFFFDKTGTLTFGIPSVEKVIVLSSSSEGKKDLTEKQIIRDAASLEQFSTHVLAQGVVTLAKELGISLMTPDNIQETVGGGIIGTIDGRQYAIGKLSFIASFGIAMPQLAQLEKPGKPAVYIACDGKLIGQLIFSDKVRANAPEVLKRISDADVETILITGDAQERAAEVSKALGFTGVRANCLPSDKVAWVQEFELRNKPVAMIGDGVNDAPALAAASVGIALGSHGATAATDVADAVIIVDDISKVADLVDISRRTMRIARQSMVAGMILSLIAMVAAFLGFIPPVQGAILQEVIDVLVIFNALRAL
ncbi:MAG: cadA [Candidatus Taylorbacteria bacterium]|nr:cadA [Candidatus Taylorbacteria bacterium]